VHVPYREQSDLPVFDTIQPDLNMVQLFRTNRYLGVDRIADTDQLSFGITSRLLDADSGEELLSATIGQALYLSEQGVTLPGQPMINTESSDYITKLRVLLVKNFRFDVGYQWGNNKAGTTRSEVALQYNPARNKVINLGYRFRKNLLEQGDVSLSWPLTQTWNFVGRYSYSLLDDKPLERFVGLEYESCCWGLRMVYRRYVSTRDGFEDSSFGLQLVLKGMASVGDSTDRVLERGILGYSREFE
jgi:LPS-assembly protein